MICFHFTIFVVLETTRGHSIIIRAQLWFAFILLSLSYWKQQIWVVITLKSCCDLLSFYYLCRTGNNNAKETERKHLVVICFHFTIFVVLETTGVFLGLCVFELWFAFILLSLSYWKQPTPGDRAGQLGCDLLSFYYLCRTGNNRKINRIGEPLVVICFHFTIFVVLETTYWMTFTRIMRCDLLSFYYLCRTGNNRGVDWQWV